MIPYAYIRSVALSTEQILEKLPFFLEREGFIILSNVDLALSIKEHLNLDYPRYQVIGVANPPTIFNTLQVEKTAGLLLPFNIIVCEESGGGSIVGSVRPTKTLLSSENDDLQEIAKFSEIKLKGVLDAL